MGEQRLIDGVPRQVGIPHGRRDRLEVTGSVGEGDAGAGRAEVADDDDAAGGYAWVILQRRQRRHGVGHERHGTRSAELGQTRKRPSERVDGGRTPVHRIRHPDRVDRRLSASDGVQQRTERVGEQVGGQVRRAVRRDDLDRIADSVDEVGDDQPTFVQFGILAG